jgi:2'-hydroxyisoflavone reductase
VPRVVGSSARALTGHAGTYAFVSTISAINDFPEKPATESSGLWECPPDAGPDDGNYAVLKAGCERAVEQEFGGSALIIQPGVILGPYEVVGRLPWWLTRISHGGRVLAPGDPAFPMQLVDARDLAGFTLDQAELGLADRFAVTGPAGNTTYGKWLELCKEATGSDAELVWVDSQFLVDQGVGTFVELPLWGGPPSRGTANFWSVPTAKAEAAGLRVRTVAETVRDTWAWLRDVPEHERSFGTKAMHGIAPEKEAAVLAAWAERAQ